MPSSQDDPALFNVRQALDNMTVDELKSLLPHLSTSEKPTRKGELVDLIDRYLSEAQLRLLWNRLDETQRNAIAETVHSDSPYFSAERFQAKYGESPAFSISENKRWGSHKSPTVLKLLFYSYQNYVPKDLKTRLRGFVPKPEAFSLATVEEPPEFIERTEEEYEFSDAEEDNGPTIVAPHGVYQYRRPKSVKEIVHQIPVTRRDTERAAQQDLLALLRLIDKGKVAVSNKTNQASAATMKEVTSLLRDGDFYPWEPKQEKWEQEIGPIKAFAWPLLLQAGKLAELHGKKLALTKLGRSALSVPAAETLKLLWQRWLKSKLLDEFNRVDVIKGQQGKGKRTMTAPEGRREVIAAALVECPVGRWVKFDDFSRFMQAAAFDFEITRQPWDLYIADANYGSLGHSGYHDWNILQARYLMALLFEYTATLGMIDVAYIDPERARDDFGDQWGTDDLSFLSRYDGLMYFRLTPLGAYCLGLADGYTPQEIEARARLTVLPSLRVKVSGALSLDEAMLLETWAEKESDDAWQLSQEKAIQTIETGGQISELHQFLKARDEQELPETVEGFIVTTERRARACKEKGKALLVECADAEIAERIATHEKMKKLCLRAGEKHLVVMTDAEEQFRKALRLMGYGLPRM